MPGTAARIASNHPRYRSRRYERRIARRTRSDPDCNGKWMCSQTCWEDAIASITSGVKSCGWGDVNRIRRTPSMRSTSRSRRANSGAFADPAHGEVAAVRVHVLPQQRHLDHAGPDQALHLGEDVADRPGPLRPADERHDAERARVVASRGDRDPGPERVLPCRRQRTREDLRVLPDVHQRTLGLGAAQELEQVRQRVGPDHDVDPRRSPLDRPPVLLCEASGDDDPQLRVPILQRLQVAEVPVELVVGVLPDRARVQDDEPRLRDVLGGRHPIAQQQPADALRVMLVHLAPEGADQERPVHADEATAADGGAPRPASIGRTPWPGSRAPP